MKSTAQYLSLFLLLALLSVELVLGKASAPQAGSVVARRIASRQMTRQKLLNRATIKRTLRPRQSAVPVSYPRCPAGSIAGYARFAN